MPDKKIDTVDAYIAQYPPEVQERLLTMRRIIHEEAPDVSEKISWEMPSFMLYGTLVHFAVQTRHIGFYPGTSAVEAYQEKLKGFKTTKGGIQLPLNQPLPTDIIREIVAFRVTENKTAAEAKSAAKAVAKTTHK